MNVEHPDVSSGPDQTRVRALAFLLATARELLGKEAKPLAPWEARLRGLEAAESLGLRIAVAGTVKSGKSTLVNALVGRDLLKRGAGIITSLVTRVRPGVALRAEIQLKGWSEVNREVTDAALFLGAGKEGRALDIRLADDRKRLARSLEDLGDEALGEGGFFDRNVALLRAYLQGYEAVESLMRREAHTVEFHEADFHRHQDFAGRDALSVYVDDLILDIPDLPFDDHYEIGDCQGYDSPNPRHMERVQDYLLGAHRVIYVVSSRVGLREADLRFIRDIKAMGLVGSTEFVLNTDLGEHAGAEDLLGLRARVQEELHTLVGEVPLHTFSALRELLLSVKGSGDSLSRKEELLLELWDELPSVETDGFEPFLLGLRQELGERRAAGIAREREAVLRSAADSLRARVEAALVLVGNEAKSLGGEEQSLRVARDRVQQSLAGFEAALKGMAQAVKQELFREVDGTFHPSGGALAEEVLAQTHMLEPPAGGREAEDRKGLVRQMARIYQELKAAFQRYKVEVVNPKAVDRIRTLWGATSRKLAEGAGPPAELLIQSVEAYRSQARSLGIDIPPLELPPLDPTIGRHTIPLFSAVTYAPGQNAPERALTFARHWTRKLAAGWAKRLVGKKDRPGFVASMLADGADAVRDLLVQEARSNLLYYNEQVKYQVLARSLDDLAAAWAMGYRETVEALVLDLEQLAREVEREGAEREDLIPRLQGILDALEPLAA